MAPRPYSDRSVLPRDSSNSSVSVESDTAQMTVDSSPGSLSAATTPSPIEQEILTDLNASATETEEDECDILHSNAAFYPTSADSMPFDHAFPDFIRQLTNERNLANVHSLRLRVISRLVSLQRISLFTTNLRELDLEGSVLGSLRDIGCNLKHLQILKVGNCKLDSLDGTFGLTSLKRLYAQKNMITDVSPCSNLPHIQHIDVSHNRIRNIGYAGFLSVCRKLKTIIFTGNPATQLPDYRDYVRRMLPQLESLDEVTFSEDEKPFQQGELEDFYDFSEEDQHDFYCNTFEKEDLCSSSGNVGNDFLQDTFKDNDFEVQNILKLDSRGFHGKDSNLLSLRKERDENKQVTVSRRGRSVNYEEMEDIVQNCSVSNWGQSGETFDGFTLPPLSVNDKETRKTVHTEKENSLHEEKDRNEKQKTKIAERAASFSTDSDVELGIPDFEAMGARPKTLGKFVKPSKVSNTSLCGSSSSPTGDADRDGARKRPCSTGTRTTSQESADADEKFTKHSVYTSLTSGRPICGNLTVAFRNRKKKQETEDDYFFRVEEPETQELNELQ